MKSKKLRFSKTFWIALAQAAVGLLAIFLNDNPALDGVGFLAIVKSAVDIFVRMNTKGEIKSL